MKCQKRKKIVRLISVFIIIMTIYNLFFRINFESFLVKDVKSYVVVKKDILDLLETKEDKSYLKKFIEEFSRAIILNFENDFNMNPFDSDKTVIVFNSGTYSPIFLIRKYIYFTDRGEYLELKPNYLKEMKNIFHIKNGEGIYLKKYRNNYIISKNLNLIRFFDKEYSSNQLNIKLVNALSRGNMSAKDISNNKIFGLDTLIATGDIENKNGNIEFKGNIYFKNNIFLNKLNRENKEIDSYYNGKGIYINTNGLKSLDFLSILYCIEYNNQNELVKSVNWEEIVKEMDSEIYLLPEKKAFITKIKNINSIKNSLKIFEKEKNQYDIGKQKFYIDNDLLQVNNKFFKNTGHLLVEENEFIKAKVKINQVLSFFNSKKRLSDNSYIELSGKIQNNYVEVKISIKEKDYRDYLKDID